ncbi:MAG: hypothetical protein O2967_09075 [Proteobacteria bacterium]|nr:hypothetical protein [Pseudomonadota bacterium]
MAKPDKDAEFVRKEALREAHGMHGHDTVAQNLDLAPEDAKPGYARVSMRVSTQYVARAWHRPWWLKLYPG